MDRWVDFVEQLVKSGPNLYRGTIVLHIEGFCRERRVEEIKGRSPAPFLGEDYFPSLFSCITAALQGTS